MIRKTAASSSRQSVSIDVHMDPDILIKQLLRASAITLLAAMLSVLHSAEVLAARNEHRPVCSDDGSRMIYMLKSEQTKDDWELYLLDIDSQVHSRLTSHPGWDGNAVWSPDGTRIIYHREDEPGERKRPWIMELDGHTNRPLGSYEGWVSINDWSADNHLVGFQELDGQRDLIMLNPDGEISKRITTTDDRSEHDAHFSPDGKKIAFASETIDGSQTTLELIDLESGVNTILQTSVGRIHGISWSPDGEQIAYVDTPEGDDDDADIFIYSMPGQLVKQVTDDPARDHMPEFCNNSHTLLFTSYRSGEERIYQVDPDPRPFLQVERR